MLDFDQTVGRGSQPLDDVCLSASARAAAPTCRGGDLVVDALRVAQQVLLQVRLLLLDELADLGAGEGARRVEGREQGDGGELPSTASPDANMMRRWRGTSPQRVLAGPASDQTQRKQSRTDSAAHCPHQRGPLDEPVGRSVAVLNAAQSAVAQAMPLQAGQAMWSVCKHVVALDAYMLAKAFTHMHWRHQPVVVPGRQLTLMRSKSSCVSGSLPARVMITCLHKPLKTQ